MENKKLNNLLKWTKSRRRLLKAKHPSPTPDEKAELKVLKVLEARIKTEPSGDMVPYHKVVCHNCENKDFSETEEPCKSCQTTTPTNYKEKAKTN